MINDTVNNLSWIHLFILTMGAYSLTRLVVTDSIFDSVRAWIFHQFPHEGYASQTKPKRGVLRRTSNNVWVADKGTFIGDLLSCPWCSGFWVSLILFGGYVFIPEITLFVLIPFAIRALVGGYANRIGGG